jgi:glycine/D-amino acid oxidase-like deaminating enzyme
MAYDVIVVGAGINGSAAALELRRRGYNVALIDPGPLPHPLAASTDISKVVRMDYGADEDYMAFAEQGREGWLRWNEEFETPLYHEVGVLFICREPMQPGSFEYESYHLLLKRGHQPERMTSDEIAKRFPAWKAENYVDGVFDREGGWAEAGRVVETLIRMGEREGVALLAGQNVTEITQEGSRVTGVRTQSGETFSAGEVVVAAGAWTPVLVPELAPVMHAAGHPIFHIEVPNPPLFSPPLFPVFGADISKTGWYGFPYHPYAKVLKVGNHGPGLRLHPVKDERVVTEADTRAFRAFLADTFPALANAKIVYTRRCLYCDTLDEHFWVDRSPDRQGLTVAAGDSGHGFKFAPLWGTWIADAMEGRPQPKFRWRDISPEATGQEAARWHG